MARLTDLVDALSPGNGHPALFGHPDADAARRRIDGAGDAESRYRWLVENSSDAVWRFELDEPIPTDLPEDEQVERCFRLAYLAKCNAAMTAMYGYPSCEALVGLRLPDLMPPDRPENVEYLRAFVRNGYRIADAESAEVAADGSPRYLVNSLIAEVSDGRLIRAWGTSRDVTDRKRTEAELRESRAMLRAVLDNIPLGVFWKDRKGAFLGMNAAAARTAGFASPEEVVGKTDDDLPGVTPEQVEHFRLKDREVLESGRPLHDIVEPIRRVDGSTRWLNTHKLPLTDADGNVIGVLGTAEDVTDRRRSEQALRAGEERLRLAHEATGLGVFDFDPLTNRHFWSERAKAIWGFPVDEPVRPDRIWKVVPAADRERSKRAAEASLDPDGCGEFAVEHRVVHPDGSVRWVSLRGRTTFEEAGGVRRAVRSLGTVLDVTDRRRADEELRQSRAMLRTILDNIPQGVFWKDRDSVYLGANAVAARAAGFADPADQVGLTDFDLPGVTREQAEAFRELDRQVMASGRPRHDILETIGRPDGSTSWLNTHKLPLTDGEGNTVGVLGTWEDVTERREAERALRESEERLRLALDAGGMGVWEIDEATGVCRIDDREAGLLGLEFEPREQPLERVLGLIHPEDLESRARHAAAARAGGGEYATEYRVVRPDGRTVWLATRGRVSFDGDGRPVRTIGVSYDVTDRVRKERTLQFLVDLNDATQSLSDPDEVMRIAARLLGEHLDVNRCAYAEIEDDEDHLVVTADYACDTFPLLGRFRSSAFGAAAYAALRAGEPFVVEDASSDPRTAGSVVYEAADVRAFLCVPLLKDGRYAAGMAVHQKVSRRWRGDEVELVRLTAERCWEAIQRVRVARRLAEVNADLARRVGELQALFEVLPVGIGIAHDPECREIQTNAAFSRLLALPAGANASMTADGPVRPSHFRIADAAGRPIPPDHLPMQVAAREGREVRGVELEVRFEDGRALRLLEHVAPLFDEAGRPRGAVGAFVDITERQRAEAALRESESRFREMADHAPVMVWVTEPDGTCSYLSKSWYEFTGQTPETGLGFGWVDATHPDDAPAAERAFREANERRAPFRIEYRLLRADGEYRWAIDSATPRFGPSGEFLGYVGSVIDITDRKEAEEAVRASEAWLRAVTDKLPAMVGYVDRDLRYRFANLSYEDWFGVAPSEVVGKTVPEMLGELTFRQRQPYIEAALRGEPVRLEAPTRHRRLGWRDTEVIYTPDVGPDGEVRGFFTLAQDVTDRKQAELRHREAEEQFRTLADNIPQLAWMADQTGWIFWYNRRWYEYTGTTPEEMEGWGWQSVHDPVELERMLPGWNAAIAAGVPWEDTFPLRRHDGEMRWHLSRAMPVRDAEGNIVRWFGTNTDVTEQRELEQALRENDRRKDEFLATLGHELRNPLASIVNAAEALANDGRAPAGESGEMVEIVERQARHMSRLMDDLLDVARIARGKILLRAERLDLAEVVRQAAEDHRREVEEAGLSLAVEVFDRPLWVEGDRTRLAQVLANLLHNAVKFTDVGGVITVAVALEEGRGVVRVRDTGLGMTPEMLGRIFVPFSQADASLARSRGGLGLGLALVKGLVDLHGGAVDATSEGLGRGSEFAIRLPLVEAGAAERGGDEGASRGAARLRVLAIDDRRDILRPLQVLLAREGHEVETATTGREGVEAAKRMRPDAVICDIGLPGELNGHDVARLLRADPDLAGVRLIALTGYGQESDRQAALAAGFDLHLTKPVDIRVLRAALAGMMPVPR